MSREMTLIVLGLFTAILPFLGFPESWRAAFLLILGIAIAAIGFIMRAQAHYRGGEENGASSFVDSRPRPVTDGIRPAEYERAERIQQ